MQVTLTNTERIVELNGTPARMWMGHAADGTPVTAFITRITIDRETAGADHFRSELEECEAPVITMPVPFNAIF